MERVKKGEIIITMTDKSGKFAVVTPELYRRAASVHLKDQEVDWNKVAEVEVLVNRFAMQLVKVFDMGSVHEQEDRIRQAYRNVDALPGIMYCLIKDHKAVKEGEAIPPTRNVCSARAGVASRLSNLTSTVINYVADAVDFETECRSTEEMLRGFLETNRKIRENSQDEEFKNKVQELVVLSMDVAALYPSLRKKEACKIIEQVVAEAMEQGKVSFAGVDWREAAKFLAVVLPAEKVSELNLEDVVPRRAVEVRAEAAGRRTAGARPGPAYWDSDTVRVKVEGSDQSGESEFIDKWEWKTRNKRFSEPTTEQKQTMMSMILSACVELQMSNHLYRFDGRVFNQQDGGPIGDELSQAVARIVMGWWDQQFLRKCSDLGIDLQMYLRYVDDTNKALIPPPLGSKLENGVMVIDEEKAETDRERPRDQVTAELLKEVADSVTDMIVMEPDYCSKHSDKKLPILDLKVYVKKSDLGGVEISHEFYKKPMASNRTILARTAFPNSCKRAVLVEETLRRLRNCSPSMEMEEKGEFLTQLALEMRRSGYDERFRVNVMRKAVERYKKELSDHLEGREDLYRSRQTRDEQVKQKGGKSDRDNWFKRGGNKATSILRVPLSDGSKLKKMVEERLKRCPNPDGVRTRVQEDNGKKIKYSLMKTDPFPRSSCGRANCPLSMQEGGCRERCYSCHTNYVIACKRCDDNVKVEFRVGVNEEWSMQRFVYVGESSRGCFTRFNQHAEEYSKGTNFMAQHVQEHHRNRKRSAEEDFWMKKLKVDKDPMRRVVREAVILRRVQDKEDGDVFVIVGDDGRLLRVPVTTVLMNTKEEFHLPRLVGVHLSQQ